MARISSEEFKFRLNAAIKLRKPKIYKSERNWVCTNKVIGVGNTPGQAYAIWHHNLAMTII